MSMASKRSTRTMCALLLVIAAAVGTAAPASAAKEGDPADAVEIYERDVYEIVVSTLRNPDATTSPDAPLFNNAGVNLDLTWGGLLRWSSVSAGERG